MVPDPDGSSQQNVLYANIQKPFWLYSYEIIFSSNISSGNDKILKENIISQRYSEPCFFSLFVFKFRARFKRRAVQNDST